MKPYRLAFAGTPAIAVPILSALAADKRFEIATVISQPDMPAGRDMSISPTPVKARAIALNIPVLQPQKISQIIDQLREMELDAIVVVAYAQIIPETVLNLPKYGCVNVHGSLLPKYRGASVLQAPIMNGDEETGVTIMVMDKTLDTGPILKQEVIRLSINETAETLGKKMAETGARLLPNVLADYFQGFIQPIAQNNNLASYVGRMEKKDGIIDWQKSAADIERFIRAMTPWPSAWTWVSGKQLKILEADPNTIELNTSKPGKTFIYNSTLAVQCGQDSLVIRRLQLEGKKAMTASEFIQGYKDYIGTILG